MSKPRIILASASLGRRTLLEKLGVPFTVITSAVDEDKITHTDPRSMIMDRARAKAEDVLKKLTGQDPTKRYPLTTNNFIIVAADSMAIIGNKTFGKVKNRAEAKTMVRALMGKTHDFVTATSITYFKLPMLPKSPIVNRWDNLTTTRVTLRTLTDTEIDEYTRLYDFRRFAAAYTLNETPYDLITKIDGSYTNVIGLPFEVLLPILRKYKILT